MEYRKFHKDKDFRIDRHGYDTDDPDAREGRVDVSPAGTEGIFIDAEPHATGEEKE
ncbi:MAG TPA: hypothetical protein VLZ07_04995 [Syntrophales bacterium]|nr:hypothetical protein [Syntrophales bacterium]